MPILDLVQLQLEVRRRSFAGMTIHPSVSRTPPISRNTQVSRRFAHRLCYQRLLIQFAPRTIAQTAANATVITITAASSAIKSKSPSSSR